MINRLLKLAISLGIALGDALVGRLPDTRQSAGTCVVINCHSISDDAKSRFGKQLDLLLRLAKPIPAARELRLEKCRRYVAITVDDVFQSFVANGLPELCRRNIPVTLFPPTGFLGRKSSWNDYGGENKVGETVASADDLKGIAKLGNVDFGSHGVTHADLALMPEAEVRQELQNSKNVLEGIVGREITAFSFPYGSYGARELRLASETGYRFFFDSTPQRIVSTLVEGLIGRVDVQPTDWNIEFRLKVCGAYRWMRRASAWKKKARSWFATRLKIHSMVEQLYRADIDAVTAAEWSELLGRFADANIYQTWSYGAIRWGEENLSHLVLRRNGEVAGMAQVRIICPRLVKRGVAYLRWGPLCQLRGRELELETTRQMAVALHEEYVSKRRLFLRILPNAFAGSRRADMFQRAFSQFNKDLSNHANTERTFLLNLSPPLEELRKKLDPKWRNKLNGAEKNNLTLVEGAEWLEYRVFRQIYEKMWSRKQFDTTVDVNEFGHICEDLPEGLKLKILICEHQGKPVGSIVCSAIGNTGIYLLGATHDEGLNTKGAYLLQWTMIKWLKENGFQFYDLGGIDPEQNPGVFSFKQGFSGQDVSRIPPFESCEAWLSDACMKAMDFVRGGFRNPLKKTGKEHSKPAAPTGQADGMAAGKAH